MPNETDGGESTTPAAFSFTEEQLNAVVNKAVTSQLKRQAEKLEATFEQRLAALKPPPAEPETSAKKGANSPELSAMEQKLQDMQRIVTEQQTRADSAERRQREDRTFNDLRTHLDKGVRNELKDVAARDLFYAQKRVSFDENGNALFKIKRSLGGGLPEEEVDLPLADGVSHWLKSKEAAAFIPAPNGGSSSGNNTPAGHIRGSSKPSGYGPNGLPQYDKKAVSDEEKVRRAQEREQWVLDNRSKQT